MKVFKTLVVAMVLTVGFALPVFAQEVTDPKTVYTEDQFNIDEGKVQYKESPNPMPDLNFLDVTDEMAEKYEMEDLGEEECMGKTCHKYSYVVLQGRKKVNWTVWAWKGIPMKYVIKQGRKESTVETVDLQLNAKIPDNILHLVD